MVCYNIYIFRSFAREKMADDDIKKQTPADIDAEFDALLGKETLTFDQRLVRFANWLHEQAGNGSLADKLFVPGEEQEAMRLVVLRLAKISKKMGIEMRPVKYESRMLEERSRMTEHPADQPPTIAEIKLEEERRAREAEDFTRADLSIKFDPIPGERLTAVSKRSRELLTEDDRKFLRKITHHKSTIIPLGDAPRPKSVMAHTMSIENIMAFNYKDKDGKEIDPGLYLAFADLLGQLKGTRAPGR